MTPATHARLLQGLNSMARKVYDAVPSDEPWPASKIRTLITGNPDMNVVKGCLGKMKTDGLVKEVLGRKYLRVEVKGPVEETPERPAKIQGKGQSMKDQLRQLRPALEGTTLAAVTPKLAQQFFGATSRDQAERAAQRQFGLDQLKAEQPVQCLDTEQGMNKCTTSNCNNLIKGEGACHICIAGAAAEAAQKPETLGDPLAFLGGLAQELRVIGEAHQRTLNGLAHRLEEAALALAGEREDNVGAAEQLKALRATLAKLGGGL